MTTTPHKQIPAIQRYKIGYASDEWGMGSSTPSGIPDASGSWVRYEDHAAVITALRTQQPAPATQQAGDLAGLLKEVLADACHYESETNLRADLYQRLYSAHAALTAAPQPSPTAQADSRPTPVEELDDDACRCEPSDYVRPADYDGDGSVAAMARRAARAPADSVLEDAGGANWQDISTAPKDGTRFVAVGNNYGLYSETQHTCIAQWFRGCWIEASDWNETSELKYLTHWMPLLPLPGSAARKQGANHDNH